MTLNWDPHRRSRIQNIKFLSQDSQEKADPSSSLFFSVSLALVSMAAHSRSLLSSTVRSLLLSTNLTTTCVPPFVLSCPAIYLCCILGREDWSEFFGRDVPCVSNRVRPGQLLPDRMLHNNWRKAYFPTPRYPILVQKRSSPFLHSPPTLPSTSLFQYFILFENLILNRQLFQVNSQAKHRLV